MSGKLDRQLISSPKGKDASAASSSKLPGGIYVFYFLAIVLGSDYTIYLSSAPYFFARIAAHKLNETSVNCSLASFYGENSTYVSQGTDDYNLTLTIWSLGQFIGCLASIFMPPKLNNRNCYLLFVALSAIGNIMYSLADPAFVGHSSLAFVGKFINGFGDGSIALGMSYLPLYAPMAKKAEALVNYRTFVSVGTAIGCAISMSLAQAVSETAPCLNPGNLCTLISAGLFVCAWAGGFAINTKKPPTKGMKSFDKSFAAIFWICLNFFRGFCTNIGNAFVPTYAYDTTGLSSFMSSALSDIVLLGCYISSFVWSFAVTAAGCVRWNQFCCNKPCEMAVSAKNRCCGRPNDGAAAFDTQDRIEVERLDYASYAGNSDSDDSDEYKSVYAGHNEDQLEHRTKEKRPLSFYFKRRNIARSTLLNSVRTASFMSIICLLFMYVTMVDTPHSVSAFGCLSFSFLSLLLTSIRFFGSAHRSMVPEALANEKYNDQALFITGAIFFFGFTTMISVSTCDCCAHTCVVLCLTLVVWTPCKLQAAAVPIFKNVIPRSSLSTMMPLFKVSLDLGKVAGPQWATFAQGMTLAGAEYKVSTDGYVAVPIVSVTLRIAGGDVGRDVVCLCSCVCEQVDCWLRTTSHHFPCHLHHLTCNG